ncbi:MAG: AMIN domain-containing protein, partial [Cyanobacteria bacterium P01_E01_bin.43]
MGEWLSNSWGIPYATVAIAVAIAQPVFAQGVEVPSLPQAQTSITQITAVQLTPTASGLNVGLSTAEGALEVPPTTMLGNALIVDIPNAALSLPDGEDFQAANPIAGIALITVSN